MPRPCPGWGSHLLAEEWCQAERHPYQVPTQSPDFMSRENMLSAALPCMLGAGKPALTHPVYYRATTGRNSQQD